MLRKFVKFLVVFVSMLSFLNASEPHKHHQPIRVALYHDKGANPRDILRTALQEAPDMALTVIDGDQLREGVLDDIDLLIVPGGSAKRESMSMGEEGRAAVRRFVQKGGLCIGICAGCYLLTRSKPTDLGLLPLDVLDKAHWMRGKGKIPVELTPLGNKIFGTNEKTLDILYHNGPIVDISTITPDVKFQILGYFRGELVGRGGRPGLMNGAPAMFIGHFGLGMVMGISPHPEASKVQVNMELNAIRWMYTMNLSQ